MTAARHAQWEVSAGLAVTPFVLGGALVLPAPVLQLGGTFAPVVSLAGSILFPALQLVGSEVTTFRALNGSLQLPSLQLGGTFAVAVRALLGSLQLPSLQLGGTFAVAVRALLGSLALPALQLGGTFAPVVSLSGSLALPALQLGGTLAVGANPCCSWLRLAASTPNAGKYDVIANVRVPSNPTNQVVSGRRPTAATSANSLPICNWSGSNILAWPIVASNNSTTKFGFSVWVKPVNLGSRQRLLHCSSGTNADRIILDIVGGGVGLTFMNTGAANGRSWEKLSGLTVNVWQFVRVQFDGTQSGDSNIMRVFVNEIEITSPTITVQGTGAPMTALHAPSTSLTYLIGGGVFDQDAVIAPLLNGTLTGPNWNFYDETPSAAQAQAFMNFDKPT